MMAPTIMTIEPRAMDHLRPNLSLMMGTRGRDRMAPREYAALMMPLRAPCGLSKSAIL